MYLRSPIPRRPAPYRVPALGAGLVVCRRPGGVAPRDMSPPRWARVAFCGVPRPRLGAVGSRPRPQAAASGVFGCACLRCCMSHAVVGLLVPPPFGRSGAQAARAPPSVLRASLRSCARPFGLGVWSLSGVLVSSLAVPSPAVVSPLVWRNRPAAASFPLNFLKNAGSISSPQRA